MKIKVLSAGALSTIQDGGRVGYTSSGFLCCGAMDKFSMRLANLLVGNDLESAVIETTFLGVTLLFDCDVVFAITGADCQADLSGISIKNYKAYTAHSGDVLTMKGAKVGARSYFAVASGFNISKAMGSLSTDLKCKIGGLNGEKLKVGDEILINRSTRLIKGANREVDFNLEYKNEITLRVIMGPQDDYFTKEGINTFLTTKYTVSPKSDRMGVRLDGDKISSINGVDILSDPIAMGSIQIPSSGTPIIMMADRQTIGGYAKIATVITCDLQKIAQARPGNVISFKKVSNNQAIKLYKQQENFIKKISVKLNGR